MNFNGEGELSVLSSLQSCTAPSNLLPPRVISISASSVELLWDPVHDDGGCSITSYHIYLKRAIDADWSEVSPDDVNDKPLLTSYEIDMLSHMIGFDYQVKLTVDN